VHAWLPEVQAAGFFSQVWVETVWGTHVEAPFHKLCSYFAIFGNLFGFKNFGKLVAADNIFNSLFGLLQVRQCWAAAPSLLSLGGVLQCLGLNVQQLHCLQCCWLPALSLLQASATNMCAIACSTLWPSSACTTASHGSTSSKPLPCCLSFCLLSSCIAGKTQTWCQYGELYFSGSKQTAPARGGTSGTEDCWLQQSAFWHQYENALERDAIWPPRSWPDGMIDESTHIAVLLLLCRPMEGEELALQ